MGRGLTEAGLVGAGGQGPGTGAPGDPGLFRDSGASQVLDFTDFGYGSTYRLEHPQVRALLVSLIDELAAAGPDVVVVEIAGGRFQTATPPTGAAPPLRRRAARGLVAAGAAPGSPCGGPTNRPGPGARRVGREETCAGGRQTPARPAED